MTDNEFSTAAAETLRPSSSQGDDLELIANQMIRNFSKLSPTQKRKTLEAMMGAGGVSAFSDDADAIPSGTAASSRKFNQEQISWLQQQLDDEKMFKEQLETQLESIGFGKESQAKVETLFFDAVRSNSDSFKNAIEALLDECCPNPFITDEDLDIVQLLAAKVEELESKIQTQERENEEIALEIIAGLANEETATEQRVPKRSTVNDWLCESHEEDNDCLYNEQQQVKDARMAQYLRGFGE
jgi:hypothetical protein